MIRRKHRISVDVTYSRPVSFRDAVKLFNIFLAGREVRRQVVDKERRPLIYGPETYLDKVGATEGKRNEER